jgi:hypothetical protein
LKHFISKYFKKKRNQLIREKFIFASLSLFEKCRKELKKLFLVVGHYWPPHIFEMVRATKILVENTR